MMPRKKTPDVPDMQATRYERGNGRFDLMTDEEVRTISGFNLDSIIFRLSRHDESTPVQELFHQLYELRLRYPGHKRLFRLEILPEQEQ